MKSRYLMWLIATSCAGIVTTAFAGASLAAPAQQIDADSLKYDIEMTSALQMKGSIYMLPPGEYRIEQFDQGSPEMFLLRQKKDDGTYSEPLAILDAWKVPYYRHEGEPSDELRLQTSVANERAPMITGWQVGDTLWRLRDVAALDEDFFTSRR